MKRATNPKEPDHAGELLSTRRYRSPDRRLRSIKIEIWPRSPHRIPLVDKILSYGFTVVVADDLKNLTFNR